MTRKIFRSILLAAAVALLMSLATVMGILYPYFSALQEQELGEELQLAAAAVEEGGLDYLQKLSPGAARITWVAADGTVRYDSEADPAAMENHASRREIQDALAYGQGKDSRISATLMEETVYRAQRLSDGTVLRLSAGRATVARLLLGTLQPMLVILAAALVLSAILASRLSKRIVEPLNALDLEHPLENDCYEELSPLLGRIHRQRQQIDKQLSELRRQSDEFRQITASMREGLVLLDAGGTILSINPAARHIFQAEESHSGQDFLTVDRSHDMSLALRACMDSGHGELREERQGREYQFDLSRIDSEGKPIGAVLLAFDVTDRESAERVRREFTANVSHELKTPLQGILGSAELLENGLVKSGDVPRFVGHIRSEAQRLMALIGDIIRLSQLDEGELPEFQPVDLCAAARDAVTSLQGAAAQRGITLSLRGGSAVISGVPALIREVVGNLCDNAVKYNVDGGSVTVTVEEDGSTASLTVEDTGVGIAPAEQERVFERFYRVDKIHSKTSGGTGLGLSIVKHAVALHHGDIHLTSAPGHGTRIQVTFPLERAEN